MTIGINFKVVLKKQPGVIGTVMEIKQIGKIKLYRIDWETDILNSQPTTNDSPSHPQFYQGKEIMEHNKVRTLTPEERHDSIQLRNQIVDSNMTKQWKQNETQQNSSDKILTTTQTDWVTVRPYCWSLLDLYARRAF